MRSRIALIGYRCTGKSTVGKLLANRLHYPFTDTDCYLETKYQQTIQQIFALEGERAFREKESQILQEILDSPEQVIATGGGMILSAENRLRLKSTCWIIWLQASASHIWKRMNEDPTSLHRRPNLSIGGLAEIEQMLTHRQSLYAEIADFAISTEELSPESLTDRILAEWKCFK